MPIDASTWVLLVLLGGWVAADSTSLAQLMVSRPLVAATLAGWVAGDPLAGATAGLVLEIFHLAVLPVGAARYPEGGPAAVVVGAVFAVSDQRAATLLTAIIFSLVWESVSEASVRGTRQLNSRLLQVDSAGTGAEASLERRHIAAVLLDVLRGAVLVVSGIFLLQALLAVVALTGAPMEGLATIALRISVVLLLAGALRLFGPRLKLAAAGAAAALLLLLFRA